MQLGMGVRVSVSDWEDFAPYVRGVLLEGDVVRGTLRQFMLVVPVSFAANDREAPPGS